MSENYSIAVMPQSVSVARICMWLQAGLGLAGLFLLFIVLRVPLGAGGGVVLFSVALPLAAMLLVGFLATQVSSRRGWVRTTGLVVELLLIPLGIWELLYGVSFGNVLGVLLPAVVFGQLCRSSSRMWFDR
ncbi:hypothetical protein ACTMTI_04515 [Nonomuraea sp. H19]|uniref:hypothetical protein n=1 Tax=Nonomuraea sp. H19 TaxID=3452206 RepID=UPI003F8CCCB1